MNLQSLRSARNWVDEALNLEFPRLSWQSEIESGARYVLLGRGKALRPALAFWQEGILIGDRGRPPSDSIRRWGLAIEMLHSYSLVHDDLPAMDNDDFRRGLPTLHRLYGDATAILVGDALLTGAFEVMSSERDVSAENSRKAISLLARSVGGSGMVAGQLLDMRSEKMQVNLSTLEDIHRKKTGALIAASLALPTLVYRNSALADCFYSWALDLGLFFQVTDDLLDSVSTSEVLGKTAGKDLRAEKTTFLTLLGEKKSRSYLLQLKKKLLSSWPGPTEALVDVEAMLDFFERRQF